MTGLSGQCHNPDYDAGATGTHYQRWDGTRQISTSAGGYLALPGLTPISFVLARRACSEHVGRGREQVHMTEIRAAGMATDQGQQVSGGISRRSMAPW